MEEQSWKFATKKLTNKWLRLFDFVFKTFLLSRKFSENDFEKLCQRPIEMEEFSEEGRSLNFRDRVIGGVYVGCEKFL